VPIYRRAYGPTQVQLVNRKPQAKNTNADLCPLNRLEAIMLVPIDAEPTINHGDGYVQWQGWLQIELEPPPLHCHMACTWIEHNGIRITGFLDPDTGEEFNDGDEHPDLFNELPSNLTYH
jgi:hypothetical protein